MIFMRKISIIFLSVIIVVSLVACNSDGGKTKKVTEEQTESVKPTEEATENVKSTEEVTETTISIQEEAATETVTGAVSQEDNKKADSKEQQKSDEEVSDSGNQHSKSAEVEQAAGNNGKDNSDTNGSDNSNSGNDYSAANTPADSGNAGQDSGSQQVAQTVSYNPQNVVSLATAKCQAGGMITTQQNLDNLLAQGKITQDEYKEYYPHDGMEESYYSVFVETDLNKASTIDGQRLSSEDAIAQYIADMLMLEKDPIFYISYDGIYTTGGTDFYEFRCHR